MEENISSLEEAVEATQDDRDGMSGACSDVFETATAFDISVTRLCPGERNSQGDSEGEDRGNRSKDQKGPCGIVVLSN